MKIYVLAEFYVEPPLTHLVAVSDDKSIVIGAAKRKLQTYKQMRMVRIRHGQPLGAAPVLMFSVYDAESGSLAIHNERGTAEVYFVQDGADGEDLVLLSFAEVHGDCREHMPRPQPS